MTKQAAHRPHTFITNMFGTVGYVATVFVWLLVLDLIVILASFSGVVDTVSTSISGLTTTVYVTDTSTQTATSPSHAPLKFLLSIVLLVLVWIFSYLTAKAASGTLRHFLVLFGRKPSVAALTMAKYLTLAMGLIGLTILLQFVSPLYAGVKLPIAFLGLAGGVVGVGAIWAQKILVVRYRVAAERVL